MTGKRMFYVLVFLALAAVGWFGWSMTSRVGHEPAEYDVTRPDGSYEVREHPDLALVATTTKIDAQGRDGSFMKLFLTTRAPMTPIKKSP